MMHSALAFLESNWPTASEVREALAGIDHADRTSWCAARPVQSPRLASSPAQVKAMSAACHRQQHFHCYKLTCGCGCHRGGQK